MQRYKMPIPVGPRGRGRNRAHVITTTRGTNTFRRRNMKKVGKKGAYKKSVKNQMVLRRAPIVETKQRVHSDIAIINEQALTNVNPLVFRALSLDDAFTILNLESFYRQQQGLEEYEVIGQNIFSKYLNLKTEFKFPQGENITLTDNKGVDYSTRNAIIQDSTRLYLICGWVTESPNFPLEAAPSPSLPAQSNVTPDNLLTYLNQQLRPYFDDDEDKLQFRPKQTTNIKIESYRRIKPNLNEAIGSQAVPAYINYIDPATPAPAYQANAHGSIPNVMRSHSWTINRKIQLTKGADAPLATHPNDRQNLFSNNGWQPFAVIYNMNYENQAASASVLTNPLLPPGDDNPPLDDGRFSQVQFIQYRYNDAHYFTDS